MAISSTFNGIAVAGGLLAIVALALTQATDSRWPDAVAGGLIGLALMAAALTVRQQNRALLTGRGIDPAVERMRGVIAAQPGVVDVPDLFGIVVGPNMLVVDGDATLADELDVPQVEAAIHRATESVRGQWPDVGYVYLTPVSKRRRRRASRAVEPGSSG